MKLAALLFAGVALLGTAKACGNIKCPCDFEEFDDRDYHGNDIGECGSHNTVDSIAQACRNDSGCWGFSYITQGSYWRSVGPWCMKMVLSDQRYEHDHLFCRKRGSQYGLPTEEPTEPPMEPPAPTPTEEPTIALCVGEMGKDKCPEGCNKVVDAPTCQQLLGLLNIRENRNIGWSDDEECFNENFRGEKHCVINNYDKTTARARIAECYAGGARWLCSSLPTIDTPAPTVEPTEEEKPDPEVLCAQFDGDKKACKSSVIPSCSWDKFKEKCKYFTCDSFNKKGWKCERFAAKFDMTCYWDFDNDVCTATKGTFPCAMMDGDKKGCKKKIKSQAEGNGCSWDKKTKLCSAK